MGTEFVEKLGMDEMNLPKVWLSRIDRNSGSVLYCLTGMSVASDAQTLDKFDPSERLLRKAVF